MNGGQLMLVDQSKSWTAHRLSMATYLQERLLRIAEFVQVKMIGTGRVTFEENAQCLVPF